MAFEHQDWLASAFVANRAACAAAGKRNLHERFLASMLSRTIGFSDAMRSSREAWSSGYSLKNPSTQFVLTTLPLGSGTSYRRRLQASAMAVYTPLTSWRFPSIGSPGGT